MQNLKKIIKKELNGIYNSDILEIAPCVYYDPLEKMNETVKNEVRTMSDEDIKFLVRITDTAYVCCENQQKKRIKKDVKEEWQKIEKVITSNLVFLRFIKINN